MRDCGKKTNKALVIAREGKGKRGEAEESGRGFKTPKMKRWEGEENSEDRESGSFE